MSDEEFEELKRYIGNCFDRIHTRFDNLDKHYEKVVNLSENVERATLALDARLGDLDEQLVGPEIKLYNSRDNLSAQMEEAFVRIRKQLRRTSGIIEKIIAQTDRRLTRLENAKIED